MSPEPVDPSVLEEVAETARFAPSAGNRRLQRFVMVRDPATLAVLRMVSPGMIARPTAVIAICIAWERVDAYGLARGNTGVWIDVGTAAQTLLLAAHSLGLAAGPVTSFSRAAVARVLNLPEHWSAEMLVCLGLPSGGGPPPVRRSRATRGSLIQWERFRGQSFRS